MCTLCNKKYKDAYVFEVESNVFFNSPKLEMKEKELVITVKLNQESTNSTETKGNAIPATYNITHFDKYWIQVGCYSQTKTKEDLQKMFHLKDTDKIEIRNGGNCRKYWVGSYNSDTEADKKLKEIIKYGNCKVVVEKWNASKSKYELVE